MLVAEETKESFLPDNQTPSSTNWETEGAPGSPHPTPRSPSLPLQGNPWSRGRVPRSPGKPGLKGPGGWDGTPESPTCLPTQATRSSMLPLKWKGEGGGASHWSPSHIDSGRAEGPESRLAPGTAGNLRKWTHQAIQGPAEHRVQGCGLPSRAPSTGGCLRRRRPQNTLRRGPAAPSGQLARLPRRQPAACPPRLCAPPPPPARSPPRPPGGPPPTNPGPPGPGAATPSLPLSGPSTARRSLHSPPSSEPGARGEGWGPSAMLARHEEEWGGGCSGLPRQRRAGHPAPSTRPAAEPPSRLPASFSGGRPRALLA